MRAEPRAKSFLVSYIQRDMEQITPTQLNLSSDFEIEFLLRTQGGCLIRVKDPTLGEQVYEIKVIMRQNLRYSSSNNLKEVSSG
jgi:hypothetical protein